MKNSAWIAGLLLAHIFCTADAATTEAGPAPIPAERFFEQPQMRNAVLSPSGRWLATIVGGPGQRFKIQVMDLEGDTPLRAIQASDTDDIATVQWVDDDWLLFSLDDVEKPRFIIRGPGLFAVRRDGTDARMLISRSPNVSYGQLAPSYRFIGLGEPGSKEILVGERHYDVDWEYTYTDFGAFNIETRKWRRIYGNAPRAFGWQLDASGGLRMITQRSERHMRYLWADKPSDATDAWREIGTMEVFEEPWFPAFIDDQGALFVTTDDAQGYTELRKFDFTSGKPGSDVLLRTPGFSTGVAPVRDGRSGPVVGVRLSLDSSETVWFSPAMKAIQEKVDARWPGRVNTVSCRPCDAPKQVLVVSRADNDPGQYLLYFPPKNEWKRIGSARPAIDPAQMGRVDFQRIKARDGRDLPVWITFPPNPKRQAYPAVVMVHGGPHVRGKYWAWDADAQFLASRGYVVIEPEFRGSTGFGEAHFRAGWKQWGGAMIDDITDAVRHVVKLGIADEKRLCVMGSSYGGYASLMSLVKEPEMYRCGIAHAAVSDPRNRFNFHWSDLSEYGRKIMLPMLLGDPVKDAAMFVATSPVEQVQRIKSPLLLVHGDEDFRVPKENGERMRDALKKAGKDFDWVLYDYEGHGFYKLENELDYWRRVEAYLAKHLAAKP